MREACEAEAPPPLNHKIGRLAALRAVCGAGGCTRGPANGVAVRASVVDHMAYEQYVVSVIRRGH